MKRHILIFVFVLMLFPQVAQAQQPAALFKIFEKALNSNDAGKFSGSVKDKVYLSLNNGITGYYSNNQAHNILADYFKLYKPYNIRFDNIKNDPPTPFASGKLMYIHKGVRTAGRVYIALKKEDNRWYISQITID